MKKEQLNKQIPLRVQFRHMPTSDAITQLIRLQIQPLQKFSREGGHCEVVIDEMHQWHKGGVYKVSIQLTIPGDRLYAAQAEEENSSREVLYSAIRIAVDDIGRQLKKHRRRLLRRNHNESATQYAA